MSVSCMFVLLLYTPIHSYREGGALNERLVRSGVIVDTNAYEVGTLLALNTRAHLILHR